MNLEEVKKQAALNAIREAHERLSATPEYQARGKMARLYMMCLELDTNHNTLTPILRDMGIEL